MFGLRNRPAVGAAVVAVSAATLLAGPLTSSASAATIFSTIVSQKAGLQLSITSNQNNAALTFAPRQGTVSCNFTCSAPDTPPGHAWAQVKVAPTASGISLVNKQTGECADVEFSAQQPGAQAAGAKVVLSACDGTLSQQWKSRIFTGNQRSFQNLLPGTGPALMLTNSQGQAILEPITVNNNLSLAEREKHVQNFGTILVSQQQ
ncbi:RICIN domain-containing protein [Streptomyces sp. R11]|uniref:RICIN domain-containing protein n=1 Tax=Streptomyces sp. R11 TaxID=3238625 RepID=A0AB39NDE6_9ACTN